MCVTLCFHQEFRGVQRPQRGPSAMFLSEEVGAETPTLTPTPLQTLMCAHVVHNDIQLLKHIVFPLY